MKLNLGCGFRRLDGYVNVDREQLVRPDLCFDLESETWPIENSSVTEIVLDHTLEHLGETVQKFLQVMRELYRVSANQCLWRITVPHYNHDLFHIDPTHVRKISPITLKMFDQRFNVEDLINRGHHTKLGLFTGVDIELVKTNYTPVEFWGSRYFKKEITEEEMNFAGLHYTNVCQEIYIECLVHKPARYNLENLGHLYD